MENIIQSYQELTDDEVILRGDQFLPFGCTDSWFPVNDSIGRTVKEQLSRRETNQAEKFRRFRNVIAGN